MAIKQSKEKKNKPKARKVHFCIEAREARQVAVAGDFNQWDQACHRLRKKDGRWEKSIMLLPGIYEYKYLVDGQWRMDPENDHVCMNCFGTRNNVLEVSGE